VDEDAMVAMARSAVCPAISVCENRLKSFARAVLAGLIKKLFLLSGLAGQPLLGLLNC
jgi:hypothetical protein